MSQKELATRTQNRGSHYQSRTWWTISLAHWFLFTHMSNGRRASIFIWHKLLGGMKVKAHIRNRIYTSSQKKKKKLSPNYVLIINRKKNSFTVAIPGGHGLNLDTTLIKVKVVMKFAIKTGTNQCPGHTNMMQWKGQKKMPKKCIMRIWSCKNQKNSSWGTCYKSTSLYSSKMSRSTMI